MTENLIRRLSFLTLQLKKHNFSEKEIKLIKKAYDFAYRKHGTQTRKSGEPYIVHPLEVAITLTEWKMDKDTIITGLLHDVLEDTDCEESEIESRFGSKVLEMVLAVTKVSKLSEENRTRENLENANNEYLIKVMMSVTKDLRPIMVKITDRMHNMYTISHLKKEKQKRIATETFNVYANIAGRLGLYHQKSILTDLSFAVLEPEKYQQTKETLDELVESNLEHLEQIKKSIKDILAQNKIECNVTERVKSIYSTYKKNEKGIDIKDIHDIFAMRIIGNFNVIDCYKILGLIHINFTFVPNTFKDYISSPKLNLYQSIHTTIVYKKMFAEIQIRNLMMDNIANYGVAAHWIYKESDGVEHLINEELLKDVIDPNEIRSQRLKNISRIKIFDVLLKNNNKWYVVTENSTILDLAYKYNPEKIGYVQGATKESVKLPLTYNPIKNDILTIDYSEELQVTPEWLDYLTNEEAKKKVREVLESSEESKESKLVSEIRKHLKESMETAAEIKKRLSYLNFTSLTEYFDFYRELNKNVTEETLFNLFTKNKKWKRAYNTLSDAKEKTSLEAYGLKNIDAINYKQIKFPDCCSKVPGMQIVGYLSKGILYIHKFNCEKIEQNAKKYVMEWNTTMLEAFPKMYYCTLTISYKTSFLKINQIIHLITSKSLEITSFQTIKASNSMKMSTFKIKVNNYSEIKKLVDDITFKFDKDVEIKIK